MRTTCESARHARFEMRMHDALCMKCGFVFEEKTPESGYLEAYYADAFSLESDTADLRPDYDAGRRIEFMKGHVDQGSRILEIGANRGDFCRDLESAGFEATGVDPLERRDQAVVEGGFIASEQTATGVFDVVASYYVLEHVTDARAWLAAVSRNLKTGGILITEVPNFERDPAASLNHEHFLHFTPYHLERLLQSCGYSVLGTDASPASRHFGFAMAARKVDVMAPASGAIMPDTAAIYARGMDEKRRRLSQENAVADDVARLVDAVGGADSAHIYFWGANEIATSIAVLLSGKTPVVPFVLDNSSQKKGLRHEGFSSPVATPDGVRFGAGNHIFVLCSPSWNAQIREQVEALAVTRAHFVDVRDHGIGEPRP